MKSYLEMMRHILDNGESIDNERTGIGTIATFGEQIKLDLRDGFPALTTKKLAFKAVIAEMLWFLKGSDSLYDLRALTHGEEHRHNPEKKTIWDANYYQQAEKELGYTNGYMGPVYGNVWRDFGKCRVHLDGADHYVDGIDQIQTILDEAMSNPGSRRLLVSAWEPKSIWGHKDKVVHIDRPTLPPCHYGFQLNIVGDNIDLLFNMRSVDWFLGSGFDIASYAALCHVFARILNKNPRGFVGHFGNTHIYKNHIEQCKEQLERDPMPLPQLWINPDLKTLKDFQNAKVEDFKLIGYQHHEAIKAPMAV